jgi:GWxTD domain-containing protein
MKTKLLFLLLYLPTYGCCLGVTFGDSAQVAPIDSLLGVADSLFVQGKFVDAERVYKDLAEQRNDPRGYVGLGKLLLVREDWGASRQQFDKALELDPSNFEARYYAAISYRETGKWRYRGNLSQAYGISQEGAYARSSELFSSVLQSDSTYRDVLYQYALLLKDQARYGDAMRAICTQLRLKSNLPIAITGLVRLCRLATHEGRGSEVRSEIEPPLMDLEPYIRAEILRSEGMLVDAEKILSQLLRQPTTIPPQLAYLSLVRFYAKKGQLQQLEDSYWKAVDEIRDEAGAALVLEDLKYILTPREILEYLSLPTDLKRDQFFPSVWNERNPTLGSPSNPRLQEHYQRLVYAEENYYLDRERFSYFLSKGYPVRDFELEDIGLVYVRFGPPDETLTGGAGPSATSTVSWIYHAKAENPEMIFHFAGSDKSFYVAALESSRMGSADEARTFAGESAHQLSTPLPGSPPTAPDLVLWDPSYFRLWRATGAERFTPAASITEKAKRSIAKGLSTERHDWAKTTKFIELPSAISAFRGTSKRTLLEVGCVVPGLSFLQESGDSIRALNVVSGFAVYDNRWRAVVSSAETLVVSRQLKASHWNFRLHRLYVIPDSYYVALYAHPVGSQLFAKSERKIYAPDFSRPSLSMSDVQLALEIKPDSVESMFDKNGLRVVLNPLGRASIQRPLYVYFEIYHASRDSSGEAPLDLNVSITPTQSRGGIISRIASLFGEKKGYFVSSEVGRWDPHGVLAKYLTIDVSRMDPGKYLMEIDITVRQSKASVSRSLPVELYDTRAAEQ